MCVFHLSPWQLVLTSLSHVAWGIWAKRILGYQSPPVLRRVAKCSGSWTVDRRKISTHAPPLIPVIRAAVQPQVISVDFLSSRRTWSVKLVVSHIKAVVKSICIDIEIEIISVSKVSIIQKGVAIKELVQIDRWSVEIGFVPIVYTWNMSIWTQRPQDAA